MMPQDIDLMLQDALLCGRSFLSRGKVADYIPELAKADPFIRGLLNIFVRNIRNLTR